MAICKGKFILESGWLDECIKKESYLDFEDFIFKDQTLENIYKFNLRESILNARTNHVGFLYNKTFWITTSNVLKNDFEEIIISAGGLVNRGLKPKEEDIILVKNEGKDVLVYLKENYGNIYSNELLLVGCLRQKLDQEEFQL